MSGLIGNITQYNKFVNSNINKNRAEDTDAFKNSTNVITLSREEQEKYLEKYIGNFDSLDFQVQDASDHQYFEKINDDGSQDYIRVINEDGKNKIIYTHAAKDSDEGETTLYEVTQADEFDAWTAEVDKAGTEAANAKVTEMTNEGETDSDKISEAAMQAYAEATNDYEEFKMFETSDKLEGYVDNIKSFAQSYIDKYDSNADGKLSYNEFVDLAQHGADVTSADSNEINSLYTTLFNDFKMDNDDENISAGELASQFLMGDIDWANYDPTKDYVDNYLDGQLNYMSYQSVSTDPSAETYDDEVAFRQEVYESIFKPGATEE